MCCDVVRRKRSTTDSSPLKSQDNCVFVHVFYYLDVAFCPRRCVHNSVTNRLVCELLVYVRPLPAIAYVAYVISQQVVLPPGAVDTVFIRPRARPHFADRRPRRP